ncbi:TPA: hypothetical protein ACYAC8_002010, partial [Neisseria meningitidis]
AQTNRRPPGKTRPEHVRKICLSMENAAASPAGRFRRHSRRQKCPTLKAQSHTKPYACTCNNPTDTAVFSKPFASFTHPPRDAAATI